MYDLVWLCFMAYFDDKYSLLNIRNVWLVFYGISNLIGYLMPNPFYTYILDMYDLVWLGFMAYQPYLIPNLFLYI